MKCTFYSHSKKTILSKTKEVAHAVQLLETLASAGIFERYEGFAPRFQLVRSGEAEFRLELGGEKIHLRARLVLQPSRRLLHEGEIKKGEILACPHIPDPLARDLRQAGIPHADLNGRLFFKPPNGLIDLRPQEVRYRSWTKGPDPFSPKASRIVRALLGRGKAGTTQQSLAEQTGTSRALVSQVLGQLMEGDLVRQLSPSSRSHPAHYALSDFNRLLDLWKEADRWQDRVAVHEYSVLNHKPDEMAGRLLDSIGGESLAFTQWYAAWLRHPYTTPPVVSAYVKKRHVLEIVSARPVSSGGNLWLIVPDDEGVWQEPQEVRGFPLVSDVQIYLDLLQIGQRGPEQAAALREWEGFAL